MCEASKMSRKTSIKAVSSSVPNAWMFNKLLFKPVNPDELEQGRVLQ